jgi:hypothetical protein
VQRIGREHVVGLDRHDLIESGAAPFQDRRSASLASRCRAKPEVEPAVEDEARDLVLVLVQEATLAGADVDDVEVVPARITVVHGNGNQMRIVVVHAEQHGVHVGVGRKVARLGTIDARAPNVEVLIAGIVLPEQDMRIGPGKPMGENWPLGLPGERAGFAQVVARRHPNVHDAVGGGNPSEPAPVGREPWIKSVSVLEERPARDERNAGIADHAYLVSDAYAGSGAQTIPAAIMQVCARRETALH